MSKYMRAVLIGVVVGFVVAFGLGALYAMNGIRGSSMPTLSGLGAAVLTMYLLANLAGNRSGPGATADQKVKALAAQAPAGKALLYLYRQGFVAKLAGLNVSIDGRVAAQLKSPRFTCITVAPGTYVVTAGFGGLAGPQNKTSELTVQIPPDSIVALRMTMQMGMLQGSVAIVQQTDLAPVLRVLAGMTMISPDIAEI
jgi:hypothetical protein